MPNSKNKEELFQPPPAGSLNLIQGFEAIEIED
jgi:hypothetical protein